MGTQTQVRRVLIVSANMGEGHNATGRALQERVQRCWPDAEIRWVDTLDAMGSAVGPAFRWTYVTNVETTPWLYEFFYASLWRMRWFARASKRFVAEWAGRGLRPVVREFRPDLVLSTYPLGTAGLAWLRARGELGVPLAAWISDFAPHPFWVYRDVDANVVMHRIAVDSARHCVPRARVTVGEAPVSGRFVPGNRGKARARLGLPTEGFVALVSCGSLGFGSVPSAVRELLAADPGVTVVVICGRNEEMRAEVAAIAPDDPRLVVHGWTDEVPDLLLACDVLVTNAGGATSLEAMACERAVLMYRPIAAHGRANAELMARAGLARMCAGHGSLTAVVRELLADPEQVTAMERRARQHREGSVPIAEQLRALVDEDVPRTHRLRAQDELFLQVQREHVPQQLGAVLMLDARAGGSPATADDAAVFLGAVPGGDSRLRARGRWRSPVLVTERRTDVRDRVSVVDAGARVAAVGDRRALDEAMAEFFAVPVDPYRYAAHARLVTGLPDGQSAFLVSVHHAFTDGIAVTNALVSAARRRPWPREVAPYDEGERLPARDAVRGIGALAHSGPAAKSSLHRTVHTGQRRYRQAELDLGAAQRVADRLGVTAFEVAIGLLAAAVHREDPSGGKGVRLMVPQSTRTVRTFRSAGNHTGAVTVELPAGDMPLRERILLTSAALRAQAESAAPPAARLVVRAIGALPPWLHRLAARAVYSGTWFTLIASALPGPRAPVAIDGSLVSRVYPVLPLAPGTAYAVGFMQWRTEITVNVTTDPEGVALAERWCADLVKDFDRLCGGEPCD